MKRFFIKCSSNLPDEVAGAKTTILRSRRRFLAQGAIAANAVWLPIFKLRPGSARTTCPAPPNFPTSIELYQQAYENWANEIRVEDLWTCAPRTPADVVAIANWAFANGYRLRPRGYMHNWSPLTVTPGAICQTKVVLVDMTRHLTAMQIVPAPSVTVKVQTGASMEALLGYLKQAGFGVTAAPAPGGLSVGGVLAIDGHGAAVPAQGETRLPGRTYGSLSNLIVLVTAVVWDQAQGQYALRTFDRSDSNCKAFLTHAGRAFLTEVTLRVGANSNLRCVSYVGIPASELFAAPGAGGSRTFASFVETAGRVEAILFPFTTNPWLKVWSVSPTKPLLSREVTSPYNYPFSAISPRPDHPEWSVAVWVNLLTLPGTPYSEEFYREMETWILQNYSGAYTTVRPEWSKGWAYTNDAAWADNTMLSTTIPNIYRAGPGPGWDWAVSTFDAFDPHRVFSNPFLDALFQ